MTMKSILQVMVWASLLSLGVTAAQADERWAPLPGSARPGHPDWPADKPVHTAIDITDDLWRTRQRLTMPMIESYFDALRRLGITRVYWVCVPEFVRTGVSLSDNADGAAWLPRIAQAAHAAGLECYAIYKPFEGGVVTGESPHGLLPNDDLAFPTLMGVGALGSPWINAHPEYRMKRQPLEHDPDAVIHTIRLIKNDDQPAGLNADNLEVLASAINGAFEPVTEPFEVKTGYAQRDGRRVTVVTLSGLKIGPDMRYIMVRCTRPSDKPTFANTASRMIELYAADGTPIPATYDEGVYERSAAFTRFQKARLRELGYIPPNDELGLPASYGKTLASSGFYFAAARPDPLRYLDGKHSDQRPRDGYIAVARGARMDVHAPHPIYPEVRAYWLADIQKLIDAGFDGVDFRVDNHTTWVTDAHLYGYNEPVLKAYRERFGPGRIDPAKMRRVQGDAYTQFLREARSLIRQHGVAMQVHINGAMEIDFTDWNRRNMPLNFEWQWRQWISEGLVDAVHLKHLPWPWGADAGKGSAFAREVVARAKAKGIDVLYHSHLGIWYLTTTDKPDSPPLKQSHLDLMVKRLQWGWSSRAIDAVTLYEAFDFTYLDPKTGRAFVSPVLREMLAAFRAGRPESLSMDGLTTYYLGAEGRADGAGN